jgi:hypothetical protein
MKFVVVAFLFASLGSTLMGSTCDIIDNGCKLGAVKVTSNGAALTSCLRLDEAIWKLTKMQEVGLCYVFAKSCVLRQTTTCKAGALKVVRDGKELTGCQWLYPEATRTVKGLRDSGLCRTSFERCELKPSPRCKEGAVHLYIGTEKVSVCEWLDKATIIAGELRKAGGCY